MAIQANGQPLRAMKHGIAQCLHCHRLLHLRNIPRNQRALCPRCGGDVSFRKPQSIARTWAWVITAMVLLVPANVLPVMTVISLRQGEPDTIFSGILSLIDAGMYPIAAVVFIASIVVPVLKLVGIIVLLLVVQLKLKMSPRQCTVTYRWIEFIGRWSMLDLFMISILVTLVDLGSIASITAGAGATAFAGVVVTTIIAVSSFDTRLIWDLETSRE
ncbi:Paraquat-inducible protein A family protein [gamma proteobacterium HdN1]|nr:Paraquat-inducible protein A family protein [gamma proteobacterium HdN1]